MAGDRRDEKDFCSQHLGFVEKITRTQTQIESINKGQDDLYKKYDSLNKDFGELSGLVRGAIPEAQDRIKKLFNLYEAKEEEDSIYHEQVKQMTREMEGVQEGLSQAAHKEQVNEVEKRLKEAIANKATMESLENCYRWVKYGFVGLASTLFLGILYGILRAVKVIP
jgi:chromosome segregation ATPase